MKKFIFSSLFLIFSASLLFIATSVAIAKKPVSLQSIVQDNFNTYTDGSVVGQGIWTSYANGNNFIVQGTTVREGTKALHNSSLADSVITKTGTALTDGRQAVYVRTENRSNWGLYPDGNVQVRLSQGQSFASSIFVAVSFKSDGHVAYYDPINDVYQNFATYNDNQWTLLQIEWRSTDKTARYKVNHGKWTNWVVFNGSSSFASFNNVGFDFVLPSGSGGVYFDSLN